MTASVLSGFERLLVVGMARSGNAAALAARRVLPHVEVIVCDREAEPEAAAEREALEAAGIRVRLGEEDHTLLDGCGLVVKSPGVPGGISLIQEAHQRGIPVWGEVEFAWRFLENPMVGVTGTNGKTTTTELIGHILRQVGWACRVVGNVGTPLSSLVGVTGDDDILVVELSSFQLEDSVELRPDVAVLLNLAEDHLDRHGSTAAYFAAKALIFLNQQPDDLAILNLDDADVRGMAVPGAASRLWFSRHGEGGHAGDERRPTLFLRSGDISYDAPAMISAAAGVRCKLAPGAKAGAEGGAGAPPEGVDIPTGGRAGRNGADGAEDFGKVATWSEVGLRGEHNLDNALAAAAVCLGLGLNAGNVAAGLISFPGVPHRLQRLGSVDGVTYVNDSKATNVDAAIKALTAYEQGVHLILGGSLKGCSFERLAKAAGDGVRQTILIGEAAREIETSFRQAGRRTVMAGDMEEAVRIASEAASPGDVVLLAPACASFDQYRDYVERGEHFTSLVKGMAK